MQAPEEMALVVKIELAASLLLVSEEEEEEEVDTNLW